ncbi:histidine kinase [Pontibacter diazotrophicus]|uniref:histidine kinase n=1 Tax=Pontibacter diazotrophicus TaxID=1400979 RepID=A0A3D8LBD0_9BACT|nr:sensor histidine kinase [Pontibacter diazotrophicus]RDV14604.1 histidine kinase [Pontibacter diazotrophicus]
MNYWLVIGVSFCYLALLFGLASWAETRSAAGKSFVSNPYIYALSMAVYCTAWTYYGSVGRAATSGLEYLAIYIGPTLMAPLWWVVLRKIIRICKVQRITTIADFISSRYGKNITLGSIVTVVCVLGVIPYISIQLKAIASSLSVLTSTTMEAEAFPDTSFFIAIGLALFTIVYGTRHIEATERHEGMVTAIAFESVLKLVVFIVAGVFVTYFVFNGFDDIMAQAVQLPDFEELMTFRSEGGYGEWFWMIFLSMLAILFLPRQFQVAVVENVNEQHLNKAMWLFPLYLFVINIFVLPIALGGRLLFAPGSIDADMFVLAIPLSQGQGVLALLVYLGGFSAATSMVIVATIALSVMMSNNLVMPLMVGTPYFKTGNQDRLTRFLIYSRRLCILLVLVLAYLYYKGVAEYYSLVEVGLVSFAAVAQFAPAVIGGIFWKEGTKGGALAGIIMGSVLWFYTLVVPSMVGVSMLPTSVMSEGAFGIALLKPFELFGLQGLDYISHAMFWTMSLNTALYIGVSLLSRQTSQERNQAEVFVDIFRYSTVYESSIIWKGTAYLPDIRSLLISFLGEQRTESALQTFHRKYPAPESETGLADPKLVTYAEKLLSGVIGSSSAHIMVGSVVKEEEISIDEVLDILRESQQLISMNNELRRKSKELRLATGQLRSANERLKQLDELKDEFLSTVTHELRTPLTSIRALSEILYDNPELEREDQEHFLQTIVKESERLSRLITQVLDLERFESGKQELNIAPVQLREVVKESVEALERLIEEKGITLVVDVQQNLPPLLADRDRLIQVLVNLISNAIKFCNPEQGEITVSGYWIDGQVKVNVMDNGKGIDQESQEQIFDKFYQARNQNIRKPEGSGLGLAICKKIIVSHKGRLWVDSEPGKGAKFSFTLPVNVPVPAAKA